jgi:hypothetical protein
MMVRRKAVQLSLADQILALLPEVATLYNRLVILLAPPGGGKTTALKDVSRQTGHPLVSLNLELSQRLLDLTARQRCLQVPRLLEEIAGAYPGDVLLLDNIELLFDAELRQDPLRCLQGLSRHRTVVAAWSGTCESPGLLVYADPGHPEYRRYPADGLLLVRLPLAA